MPSTYSTLAIQLMATGENSTTWGNVTNINLGTAMEEAIVGTVDVPFTTADVTLSLSNSNASQSVRNLRLNLTGTPASDFNLIIPATAGSPSAAFEKPYIINNTTGRTITVKHPTGTGVAVPTGKTMWVYANGTNVVDVVTHLSSLTLGSALALTQGAAGTPSYTFTGDTNTGMWSPAADTIAFSEGGVEAMRITSAGDVGIGTVSPASKLAVYGGASGADTRVTIGNAASAMQVGVDNSNQPFLYGNAAFPMLFYTNALERMRITSTGDVGIGTVSPGGLLQLNKASGAADLRLSVAGTLYGNIYASASDVDIFAVTAIPIIFGTTNTERFRIGPAGQWGIGGANYGTSGQVFISQGTASAPIWSSIDLSTGTVTGTLPVGRGGLGITTTPSNGQIPIGNGTNYTAATLTPGNNTAVTNAAGSVTIGSGALTTAGTTSGALVAADVFKQVKATAGVTMPASVFTADQYVYIRNTTAGSITITQGGGLTLRFVALTGDRTLARYGFMTVLYISATEAWVVGGVGVT